MVYNRWRSKAVDRNKLVLDICPNFYRIINFEYFEEDSVTEKLIKIYEDFIFKADLDNREEINMVKRIDYVLGKYIDDYFFRRRMQQEIFRVKVTNTCTNILKTIVENIISIFNKYEEDTKRNIYISRWI